MIGTGWVASAGALIYVAAPLEDRNCLPNPRFLLHQPSGQHGTNRPAARTDRARHSPNFWLDAEEAKAYGLVARIVRHVDEPDG